MGSDKAWIECPDGPLLDVLVRRLSGRCARVHLLARMGQVLPPQAESAAAARQDDDGSGPLGAVVRALHAVTTPWAFVLACDHPLWTGVVLDRLRAMEGPAAVRWPVRDGVPQPLHALVRRSAASALQALWDSGLRSPLRAFNDIGATSLLCDDPAAARDLMDADDPTALASAMTQWSSDVRR